MCMIDAPRKPTILVVDDVPENIDVLTGILRHDYSIRAATNGPSALALARRSPPDLILLDVMMPGMDGFEVCRELKADLATRKVPVIFVTAMGDVEDESRGFDVGCVDYITKPVSPPIVRHRVKTHLALYDQNRALEYQVFERTVELEHTRLQVIHRLGRAAEYRDNETGMHVIRMSHYAYAIGKAAGLGQAEADLLLNAAPMHDLGKIGIPDALLTKPSKLSPEEWDVMRKHCEYGAAILGDYPHPLFQASRVIALTHHEKWNGEGYPHGLAGEEIPRMGRIVALADVFDALTSVRPYKEAWSVEAALEWIKVQRGQHFDPALVDVFFSILPEILTFKEKYAEDRGPMLSPFESSSSMLNRDNVREVD
ncbi:MAG TPA: two-component system response regulator [Thiobacillaceae bacterium]|nr:two-component system response regulator [Thiobacillaceae bacterium]